MSAWLLTEEGAVNGVSGNRRAGQSDRLWSISLKDLMSAYTSSQDINPSFWRRLLQPAHSGRQENDHHLQFSVGNGVAALQHPTGHDYFIYHVETGEIIKMDKALFHPKPTWYRFYNPHKDECDLYHYNLHKHHETLECGWPISQNSLHEGWVKDPDGKHRLWLPVGWRSVEGGVNWFNKTTTLRLKTSDICIIKF